MEVTVKELRSQPGRIIEQVNRGVDVVVTLQGRKVARIVPFDNEEAVATSTNDELFGLWKDRGDLSVADTVRALRRGRFF